MIHSFRPVPFAALLAGATLLTTMDGVARIITNGLSRAQVTAIAQALMTP